MAYNVKIEMKSKRSIQCENIEENTMKNGIENDSISNEIMKIIMWKWRKYEESENGEENIEMWRNMAWKYGVMIILSIVS